MIILYSGTPGSGKSLHQARDIYYWLKMGKPVIANYEIDTGKIKTRKKKLFEYKPTYELTPQYLQEYAEKYFKTQKFREGAIRLYIDEAQLIFNAREWDAKGRKEWLSFFTQHRKLGYDVYLVAQFDRMLDRQIRSLIEFEVKHLKVINLGLWGLVFSFWCFGRLFLAKKVWYSEKELVNKEFFVYRGKYSKLYDTYKRF